MEEIINTRIMEKVLKEPKRLTGLDNVTDDVLNKIKEKLSTNIDFKEMYELATEISTFECTIEFPPFVCSLNFDNGHITIIPDSTMAIFITSPKELPEDLNLVNYHKYEDRVEGVYWETDPSMLKTHLHKILKDMKDVGEVKGLALDVALEYLEDELER